MPISVYSALYRPMKLHLSKSEILLRRRTAAGLEPLRSDATMTDLTGLDIDAALLGKLRARYLRLLDTAPAAMLAPADIAPQVTMEAASYGGARLVLPDNCRRVLSVRLEGWQKAAAVLADNDTAASAAQTNPRTAATAECPAAVICADGSVCVWPATGAPVSVVAAVDDGPEVYHIDEAALEQLFECEYNMI